MLNNFDQRFNGIGIRIDIVDMCFDRSIGGIHHCLEERLVCVPPGWQLAMPDRPAQIRIFSLNLGSATYFQDNVIIDTKGRA